MAERLVAVLGYSGRGYVAAAPDLRAAACARARQLAADGADGDPVRLGAAPEADGRGGADARGVGNERRRAAQRPTARSTAGNAANVAAAADALGVSELVVVTSRWHRPRARILFRAALRGRKVRLSVEGAPGPRPPAVIARELVCLAFVPLQLARVRRAAGRTR